MIRNIFAKTLSGRSDRSRNRVGKSARVRRLTTVLRFEQLETRRVLANVGYYDLSAEQGNVNQEAPIIAAGHTPVFLDNVTAADLANIDVLFAQNPDNGGFGAEWMANLADIDTAVQNGLVLILHDRNVTDAAANVPGAANITFVRNTIALIDVLDDTTTVTNGPGGVIDDDTLDGGNFSNHGYAEVGTVPAGTIAPLSTDNADQLVTFCYEYGSGAVIYSSIPLDFYLNGSGNNPPGDQFRQIYAPNVIQWGVEKVSAGPPIIAIGASDYPGSNGVVSVFDTQGNLLATLQPFGNFEGGVRVAVGDFNGDGFFDVACAAGPTGAPNVQVFAGSLKPNGSMQFDRIASFFVTDPNFTGGVYVAAGDINGDGIDDVIAGLGEGSEFFQTDAGAPLIRVIDGTRMNQKFANGLIKNKAVIANIAAFGGSVNETGVRVGAADVNGDGRIDVLAAEGPGGNSRVWAYNGLKPNKTLLRKNAGSGDQGAYVAGGDVNDDGFADLIAGQGGSGTEIRVFSGADGKRLARFVPFNVDESFNGRTGVRVGSGDVNDDGIVDILAATGRGLGFGFDGSGNTVKAFDISTGDVEEVLDFTPFPAGHGTGLFVGGNGGLQPLNGGAAPIINDGGGQLQDGDSAQGEAPQLLGQAPTQDPPQRRPHKRDRVNDSVFAREDFWLGL